MLEIKLEKAQFADCPELHAMQVASFQALLDKYQDYATNPAGEDLTRVQARFRQGFTTYWFITMDGKRIGGLRVCDFGQVCRLSPIFILPEYQGRGAAQLALQAIELQYPNALRWELDTIAQERKLCHLYEKLGYCPTGKQETIRQGMDIVFYAKNIQIT